MRKRYSKEWLLENKERLIINSIIFIQAIEGVDTTSAQALAAYRKIQNEKLSHGIPREDVERVMSPYRTNNICDHCGRTATLEGICEDSNKPYPTGWYCSDCLAKLYAGKWRGSENPTIINGAQFQPEAGRVNISPSVWTGSHKLDKIMKELEQTIKNRVEKEAFQKDILEYLRVTADMAENNDELAWRIWQVYGRLEDLWGKQE